MAALSLQSILNTMGRQRLGRFDSLCSQRDRILVKLQSCAERKAFSGAIVFIVDFGRVQWKFPFARWS